jgi:hypothetical protein
LGTRYSAPSAPSSWCVLGSGCIQPRYEPMVLTRLSINLKAATEVLVGKSSAVSLPRILSRNRYVD